MRSSAPLPTRAERTSSAWRSARTAASWPSPTRTGTCISGLPASYWPSFPSIHSRSRSAWPLCRAYSSITWTSTQRSDIGQVAHQPQQRHRGRFHRTPRQIGRVEPRALQLQGRLIRRQVSERHLRWTTPDRRSGWWYTGARPGSAISACPVPAARAATLRPAWLDGGAGAAEYVDLRSAVNWPCVERRGRLTK